jgi:hypothetical protein
MLRNLVSNIDVDQLVEDAGALNALTALMDEQVPPFPPKKQNRSTVQPELMRLQTSRWGVKIKFVRVQVGAHCILCMCACGCAGRVDDSAAAEA